MAHGPVTIAPHQILPLTDFPTSTLHQTLPNSNPKLNLKPNCKMNPNLISLNKIKHQAIVAGANVASFICLNLSFSPFNFMIIFRSLSSLA